MKNLVTYINESKGQRLSLRKTNKPYDPEHDILIQLKDTRDARSKELKVKHAEENHKIAFDNLINIVKTVQKNKSEIKKYFDLVYFDNGGYRGMDIDLLTCDINKFSYKFLASSDHYAKDGYIDDIESEILYDNKPYKWCRIFSDLKNVSRTWLSSCALELVYNDNINYEMAEMAVKQFNGGKDKYNAVSYKDKIELRVCEEQSLKKLIKSIDDIVDRW